jgi:hypothetical protein
LQATYADACLRMLTYADVWQVEGFASTSHGPPPVSPQKVRPHSRQHTSAYVSIRQHTSAYVSIRQHTSAYFSIRQQPPVSPQNVRPHLVAQGLIHL